MNLTSWVCTGEVSRQGTRPRQHEEPQESRLGDGERGEDKAWRKSLSYRDPEQTWQRKTGIKSYIFIHLTGIC